MELDDCAFPLLAGIDITDDPQAAFDGVNVALLVGARPRAAGMERGDLLEANGGIFKPQGEAINAGAADDVRVLVVGNPANTNALIAPAHAPDVPSERFTAMTRLDHNRAVSQLAAKAGCRGHRHHAGDDLGQPLRDAVPGPLPRRASSGTNAAEVVDDQTWLEDDFIPTVAKRGAAIIEARGSSSAASAANAAIDHVYDWVNGTPDGDWISAAHPVRRLLRRARGPHLARSRCVSRAASGRSSRASRSTTSRARRIDASVAELARSATPSAPRPHLATSTTEEPTA